MSTEEPLSAFSMTLLLSAGKDLTACHSALVRFEYLRGVSVIFKYHFPIYSGKLPDNQVRMSHGKLPSRLNLKGRGSLNS